MIEKARNDVIKKQFDLGLDVITDGEIERENYIFHCARNFKGINMESITTKTIRDGKTLEIHLKIHVMV
jgi:5-methyltetrahydropteroyltriglutamate--homocysteine methyltransferase